MDHLRTLPKSETLITVNCLLESLQKELRNQSNFKAILDIWQLICEAATSALESNCNWCIVLDEKALETIICTLKTFSINDVILKTTNLLLLHASTNNITSVDSCNLFSLFYETLRAVNKALISEVPFSMLEAKSLLENILDCLKEHNPTDYLKIPLYTAALPDIAIFLQVSRSKDFENLHMTIVDIISESVFNSKTKPYKSLLNTEEKTQQNDSKAGPDVNVMEFFCTLHSLVFSNAKIMDSVSSAEAASLCLQNLTAAIFRKHSEIESLKILSLLCANIGFDIPLSVSSTSCCNRIFKEKIPDDSSLLALSNILEACTENAEFVSKLSQETERLKLIPWLESLFMKVIGMASCNSKMKCVRLFVKLSLELMEKNLLLILKCSIFGSILQDAKFEEEYCNLFEDLLSLHSKLHQFPRFFVKLLRALIECIQEKNVNRCIKKGQLYPGISQSLAKYFEILHFAQIIELWSIFSETFSTFWSMCDTLPYVKGAVLYLSQIYSAFLLHTKLFDPATPAAVIAQYGNLVNSTAEELESHISILNTSMNDLQLQNALLLLCHALGEVKIVHPANTDSDLFISLTLEDVKNPCDCSVLHKFLKETSVNNFELFLNDNEKSRSFLTLQLMMQKVRALMYKTKLDEEEKDHLQSSISMILNHAKCNLNSSLAWNLDLNTLSSENYGCAIWRMVFRNLPLMMNFIQQKKLIMICECIRDAVLFNNKSSEIDLRAIVLSFLKNECLWEFRNFQTAFVAAMWKLDDILINRKRSSDEDDSKENLVDVLTKLSSFRSKWAKYAKSTPKHAANEPLNSLWTSEKDTCDSLERILNSSTVNMQLKINPVIYNLFELLELVPLSYLLPGNQIHCIVGISSLFFLLPYNFEQITVTKIVEKAILCLASIFDGPRSIWLFDFISCGPYLREMTNAMQNLQNENKNEQQIEGMKFLLSEIIHRYMINDRPINSLVGCFSQIISSSTLTRISILTLHILVENIAKIFQKRYIKERLVSPVESLAILVCSSCVKGITNQDLKSDETLYCALLECYADMLDILAAPKCTLKEKKIEKYLRPLNDIITYAKENILVSKKHEVCLKFFTKLCQHQEKLSAFLPQDFQNMIWQCVCMHFQLRCSVTPCLNEDKLFDPLILKQEEINILKSLSCIMSQEMIDGIFEDYLKQMEHGEIEVINAYTLQMHLNIIRQMTPFEKQKTSFPVTKLTKVLMPLHFITSQASDSIFHTCMIKLPVLHFISFLIKRLNKTIRRQCLVQTLHSCMSIKLQTTIHHPQLFVQCHERIWDIVYNILIHHPVIAFDISASLFSIISSLLKSLISAGSQDKMSTYDSNTYDNMISCAESMNRLLTILSRNKHEINKLVVYLIADYVENVQYVTLNATVKRSLLNGINRLITLCSEDSIKMLSVNISTNCHDVFTNIIKNHKQHRHLGFT